MDPDGVRVSFIKIIELQVRAIPHIHALIRLDPHENGDDPDQTDWESPTSATKLAAIIEHAARTVTLALTDPTTDSAVRRIRFGTQIDTQPSPHPRLPRKRVRLSRIQVSPGHCQGGGWRAISPSTSPSPWPTSESAHDASPPKRSATWTCPSMCVPS
ncbi:putative replication initiator protein [Mycobacterium kansasii]|uniref:Putative replication initiator protein n=1 Tax=Mycobacterium kansasii TaxID=1768 RepID=A0A1V3WLG3_MYCKA|nr:putative replication initiator protein [Mycobacterium kansasii]